MRYLICFAYNGFLYHGWAKQPGWLTVQSVLEEQLFKVFKTKINLVVAARTDKQVHALRQYCHFDFKNDWLISPSKLVSILNRLLPSDVHIWYIKSVGDSFHARYSAKSKTYVYVINTNPNYSVFQHTLTYQYNKSIDLNKCQQVLNFFVGLHDFSSFTTELKMPVKRRILSLKIIQWKDLYFFVFVGHSFLRSMIRMIVGTILAYNENKINTSDVQNLFTSPKKGQAVHKVPGWGLYLMNVDYSKI